MPIDDSTWGQAIERESTATQVLDYLKDNQSEAYTTNELVGKIVPEDTDENVVAYYRAILEALTHEGYVEKREVSVDADEADLIPYYRVTDEQPDESEDTEQSAMPAVREVHLDGPIEVRMAAESDAIPVHIEDSIPVRIEESQPNAGVETPFFVRWHRWYQRWR